MGTSYSTDLSSSVIDLHELSNSNQSQKDALVKSFFEHGFIILKLDLNSIQLLKSMYELSDEFFSQSEDKKMEVSMNLSKKENHPEGYLRVGTLRETLKYRTDENYECKWPSHPANYKTHYWEVIRLMRKISTLVFTTLGSHRISENKELISTDDQKNILEVASTMSLLTMIHYFGENPPKVSSNSNNNSTSESSMNSMESTNLPCPEHTDTGLLTFIPIASVPALQVKDKKTNNYVEVERHFPKYEYMAVIMGEKMSLFANHKELAATVHKVVMMKEPRTSLTFMLDVTK